MNNKEEILNRLEDVEEIHRKHKRTYSIPRSDERQALRPGQLVKLVFLADEGDGEGARAERMWVEVQGAMCGEYIGVLTNRPRYLKYVKQGEHVVFRPKHVCAIYVERSDPNWIDPEKFVMVSKRVTEDEAWPDRLQRRQPHSQEYAGWIIFGGETSKEEQNNSENFVPLSMHDLMNKFPILDSVLGEPIGSEWAWDEDCCEYKPIANRSKSQDKHQS